MKNLPLKLILLSLIAGTALVPEHADAMTWKKWLTLGAFGASLMYAGYKIIKYNQKKLLSAAKSGDIETVKHCLYYGAHLNTQDNDGYTPLMLACAWGHTDIVQYLVKNGAHLNTKSNSGWTPLMWACINGYTNIVQCLVENGANLNTQDKYDRTAYDIAVQRGNQSTAEYLAYIQNELKNFKVNPLQPTTIAPKSTFIKILYKERIYYIDTSKYTVLCSIFAKFQKSNNHNELKKILDDCKFLLQCSKEEIKKLNTIGFSLTSGQFDMQLILLKHKNDNAFTDLIIE